MNGVLGEISFAWQWSLDGWIGLAGMLCAMSAALLGCFLLLRRMSLLGDAISHAVLPGIAAAFIISGSRSSIFMFIGAVLVGLLTVWLTEAARSFGRVDEGAATGVVFTSLFAIGLVMIETSASHVDLDPGCVLYGDIEMIPLDLISIGAWRVPRVVAILAVVFVINCVAVLALRKEFQITTFDAGLARSQGYSPLFMHYLLASLVAITSVCSFEAVGNILVVAMFVVPPATALLLTKRLGPMILLSLVFAIVAAWVGHISALVVPRWFGFQSTSTSAMMSVVAGLLLLLAVFFSPQHGLLVKFVRRRGMAGAILAEDILATLFRSKESGQSTMDLPSLQRKLLASGLWLRVILKRLQWRGEVALTGSNIGLTATGVQRAQNLVRSHRLWEKYLSTETDLVNDRLHVQAEGLEHFTSRQIREQLDHETNRPSIDPHGKTIPPESQ
jgi:manganese/zinc/iron transport system permease protein